LLTIDQIAAKIRTIPDFPEPGIQFKDITPLLKDAEGFASTIEAMAQPWLGQSIDAVVAIEARGYMLGAPLAARLGCGFVPVRKVGKLPFHTYRAEYALEYGTAAIEIHRDAVGLGERVLIIDDVLATGGTLEATAHLVHQTGGTVAGMGVLMELSFLPGRARLKGFDLRSLIVV